MVKTSKTSYNTGQSEKERKATQQAVAAARRKRTTGARPSKAKPTTSRITRDMAVADILALCPEATPILAEYGLHCVGCSANGLETMEVGCKSHGFSDEEIGELVDDINLLIERQPDRPKTLDISTSAAVAIRDVAKSEGRSAQGLAVIVDGQGGFCMEFKDDAAEDETTFQNADVPEVRVFASALTLKRIGGSRIDFREGRFKLDLPDAPVHACGCGEGKTCDCT